MFKIGAVARQAGVGIDTVRYYERRGLLPGVARRASGYREFTAAAVERIRFARDLQALGFTLDEIAELLGEIDAGTVNCARGQPRFARVLTRVAAKIAALEELRRRLVATVGRCRDGSCTLLDRAALVRVPAKKPKPPTRVVHKRG